DRAGRRSDAAGAGRRAHLSRGVVPPGGGRAAVPAGPGGRGEGPGHAVRTPAGCPTSRPVERVVPALARRRAGDARGGAGRGVGIGVLPVRDGRGAWRRPAADPPAGGGPSVVEAPGAPPRRARADRRTGGPRRCGPGGRGGRPGRLRERLTREASCRDVETGAREDLYDTS